MFENIKSIYSKYKTLVLTITGLVAILLVVLAVNYFMDIITKIKAYPYIGLSNYTNTITISGQGKVYAKPDIGIVNLSVVTEGSQIKAVQKENAAKMNKIIEFLKGFGIEEKDIKTTNYNLYPRYNYEGRKIPQIIGYEITQTLEVKVRNLETVGDILERSVENGINQVNSLRFWVDDDKALKDEARILAINDAKEKARKLSEQLGIRLDKIISYNDDNGYDYPVYRGLEAIGGSGAPQVEVGENEILVNVTLIYEINR